MINPLAGYDSAERSYMVSNYPYGGQRCRIRFWLECDQKRGYRFCSQTEHPKRLVWNAPKKSTYTKISACMFLDDKGHCMWDGISEYSSADTTLAYVMKYSVTSADLLAWCKAKARFEALGAQGKLKWSVNGVVREPTETDLASYKSDEEKYGACVGILTARIEAADKVLESLI